MSVSSRPLCAHRGSPAFKHRDTALPRQATQYSRPIEDGTWQKTRDKRPQVVCRWSISWFVEIDEGDQVRSLHQPYLACMQKAPANAEWWLICASSLLPTVHIKTRSNYPAWQSHTHTDFWCKRGLSRQRQRFPTIILTLQIKYNGICGIKVELKYGPSIIASSAQTLTAQD